MARDRSIDTASTKENIHKMKIIRLKEVKTTCQPDEEQKVLYRITQVLFSLHLFRAKHTIIHENIKYHSLCRNCSQKLLVDTCERYWPRYPQQIIVGETQVYALQNYLIREELRKLNFPPSNSV